MIPAALEPFPESVQAISGGNTEPSLFTAPQAPDTAWTPVLELGHALTVLAARGMFGDRGTGNTADADPIPAGVRYRQEIFQAARAQGLDPLLLAAVAAQETGGPGCDLGANVAGADGTGHGVFQIDSGTWEPWLAAHHQGMNVAENAAKAAEILRDDLTATGGDVRRALHRYNAGSDGCPSTRTVWPDGSCVSYEDSVLRHLAKLETEQKRGLAETKTAPIRIPEP